MARNRIHDFLARLRKRTEDELRKEARAKNRVRVKAVGRRVPETSLRAGLVR